MPSPFPGMDPFLEGPLWNSFHAQFCSEIARRLTPSLGPRYIALVEERLVVDTMDGVSIATRVIQPDVSVAGTQGDRTPGTAVLEPPLRLATVMEAELPMHFVEIRDVANRVVVTVIEVLSPTNKGGDGLKAILYQQRVDGGYLPGLRVRTPVERHREFRGTLDVIRHSQMKKQVVVEAYEALSL